MENKRINFEILVLSVSIIIGSLILSSSIKSFSFHISEHMRIQNENFSSFSQLLNNKLKEDSLVTVNHTYDLHGAAFYLGITEDQLKKIMAHPNSKIPYVKVGYTIFFSKHGLDEWMSTSQIIVEE